MPVIYALLTAIFLFVVVMLAKTVRIIPQARAGIVERFGKYKETLPAGPQHRRARSSTRCATSSTCASRWSASRRSR